MSGKDRTKKPKSVKLKIAAGIAVVAVAFGTIVWTLPKNIAYYASRVIDGDTFETMEKQRIRLASADAPELGLCGSEQSKKALEKLVLNKPLYIKVLYRDTYNRLISAVYTQKEFVNAKM